jgi:hypothetical protein
MAVAARERAKRTLIAMGYDDRDLPYWNIADRYVLFDAFFSSAAGASSTICTGSRARAPGRWRPQQAVDLNV